MKITEVITNTYEIDDEILSEYLDYCNEENVEPKFDDFISWFDEQYYFSDFLEDDNIDFESVNGSFQTEKEFQKEIDRLLNEKKDD